MKHREQMVDADLEHVAEEIWTLAGRGEGRIEDLQEVTQVEDLSAVLERMTQRGLLQLGGGRLTLTAAGMAVAELQARRHRLAEMLLSTVLAVQDDSIADRTACLMEHILHPSVTDSVCAFLGHPKFCPHGEPIPPGACCRTLSESIEPLVQPLDRLAVGQRGRIVYVAARDAERLVRLSTLGLTPGATVRLQQVRPAAVVSIGESTVALEREIAAEIYVKKIG